MKLRSALALTLVLTISLTASGCKTFGVCKCTRVQKEAYGKMDDGTPINLYTLTNKTGAQLKITNYGCLVTSITVPDKNGKLDDVVLGYDKLGDYIHATPYFGAFIGRYGNRIAKGKFTLNGKTYTLTTNNGENALHGGEKGFDKVVWNARQICGNEGASIEFTYVSKDGEEGYPGTLTVKALHTWTDNNELKIVITATTDKDTVCNLTHHSYFNLAGCYAKKTILDHKVMIAASRYTPVDSTLIPTGELAPVKGTPFDFTTPRTIGSRVNQAGNQQLTYGKGYDHNYVLDKPMGKLGLAARVSEETTGRVLEVLSTEPGLQFYVGNFLDGTTIGKGGIPYLFRYAFCMEPQHYPDSPNQKNFPSVVLRKGAEYKNTIIYRFSVSK